MKVLNGITEVEITTITPPINEVFQLVTESVSANEYDLGDFEEKYEELKLKIEEGVEEQEEPIILDNEEDEWFIMGLALMLGIRL